MTTYTDILLQDTANNYFIPYGLINRLGDVDISNPTTGQNLTYDATSGKWKNTSTSATVAWGGITGTLSDQTDLQTVLNGKQSTLVSGTNIKTINNTSLLGSGDISVLQNTATGTGSLDILGTSSYAYSISIGSNSTASGMYSVALGRSSSAYGSESIAIGYNAKTTNGNYAIQIGNGTNSITNSLAVGFDGTNYQLLDGTTGLIPDARISSNIARTSAIPTIPTNISSFTNDSGYITGINSTDVTTALGYTPADTTLSNVSSIDSNSAVQTALDGKVSKSGDTMTGNLTIDNSNITLRNANVTKGTTPSTQTWQGIGFFDSTTDTDWANARLGVIECSVDTNGTVHTSVRANKNEVGSTSQAYLDLAINSSGVASCTFPNTTCVDGQWVNSYLSITSGQSGTDKYSKDFSLSSYLPNDGKNYEVLLCCGGRTGTTSGNSIQIWIGSDIMGTTLCAYENTRTNSYASTGGAVILPVGTGRKITMKFSSSNGTTSNVWLQAKGYRRIGTNS